MCARSQSALADRILEAHPGLSPVKMQWDTFESGNPNFVIRDHELIRRAHVIFIADATTPRHVIEQWAVLCALQHYGAYSLTVFMPYFPGTLDRVDVPGRIVWGKTVARLFSEIPPLHGTGTARIVIYDIHAEQEVFFFTDQVANDFQSVLPYLLGQIRKTWTFTCIAFPDAGAKKRFADLEPGLHRIVCEKHRTGTERIIHIVEGDPRGKHVLLIDDLVMSGGTLIESAKAMISAGALSVRAVVAHPVLPGTAIERFTPDGPIEHLYVSDSIPITSIDGSVIEVISLAPLIAQEIRDTFTY